MLKIKFGSMSSGAHCSKESAVCMQFILKHRMVFKGRGFGAGRFLIQMSSLQLGSINPLSLCFHIHELISGYFGN